MQRGKELLGKSVIANDTQTELGKIQDVIVRRATPAVVGLVLRKSYWLLPARIIPLTEIVSINDSSIVVGSTRSVCGPNEMPGVRRHLDQDPLVGSSLISANGHEVGEVYDFYFDERSGVIDGFDVLAGNLSTEGSKPEFLPLDEEVTVRIDSVVISALAYDRLMFDATEKQRGVQEAFPPLEANRPPTVKRGISSGLTATRQFAGIGRGKLSSF